MISNTTTQWELQFEIREIMEKQNKLERLFESEFEEIVSWIFVRDWQRCIKDNSYESNEIVVFQSRRRKIDGFFFLGEGKEKWKRWRGFSPTNGNCDSEGRGCVEDERDRLFDDMVIA